MTTPFTFDRPLDLVFRDTPGDAETAGERDGASRKPLRDDLSCVVSSSDGRHLWLVSDETACIERLTYDPDGKGYGHHHTFDLRAMLDLPGDAEEEADIEGLAVADGWLWVVGSHSLARRKPDKEMEDPEKALARLTKVKREANRFLLGRVPMFRDEDGNDVIGRDAPDGRRAGRLKMADRSNVLADELHGDEHIHRFMFVPAKENGFDIEGIVVTAEPDGRSRVFLGLRGPVLRGWAIVLEILVRSTRSQTLKLVEVDRSDLYQKCFLNLDGLGIRSLLRRGDDLWLLAGPTMDLDGPVGIYRWQGFAAAHVGGSTVVPHAEIQRIADIPFGHGVDHAEGMTVLTVPGDTDERLLVVYDSPAKHRTVAGGVRADLFTV